MNDWRSEVQVAPCSPERLREILGPELFDVDDPTPDEQSSMVAFQNWIVALGGELDRAHPRGLTSLELQELARLVEHSFRGTYSEKTDHDYNFAVNPFAKALAKTVLDSNDFIAVSELAWKVLARLGAAANTYMSYILLASAWLKVVQSLAIQFSKLSSEQLRLVGQFQIPAGLPRQWMIAAIRREFQAFILPVLLDPWTFLEREGGVIGLLGYFTADEDRFGNGFYCGSLEIETTAGLFSDLLGQIMNGHDVEQWYKTHSKVPDLGGETRPPNLERIRVTMNGVPNSLGMAMLKSVTSGNGLPDLANAMSTSGELLRALAHVYEVRRTDGRLPNDLSGMTEPARDYWSLEPVRYSRWRKRLWAFGRNRRNNWGSFKEEGLMNQPDFGYRIR